MKINLKIFLSWVILLLICNKSYLSAQPKFNIYNGDTINRVDDAGKKQGKWMKFYKTDTVFYRGQFKDDKPLGTFTHYYSNGVVQSKTLYISQTKARFTGYYETGKIKATGIYVNQKKDSVWKYFNENDSLASVENYKLGVGTGEWKTFYPSGKISETTQVKNGKKNGTHKEYFPDGKLKIECTFVDDKINGLYKSYYNNGIAYFEGPYKMGIKHGTWILHDETGKTKAKEVYVNGNCANPTITDDMMSQ